MSQKWTRRIIIYFIVAVVVVSGYFGYSVAEQNRHTAQMIVKNPHSFTAYILDHHIGSIVSQEGGLGMDAGVLEVSIHKAIPVGDRAKFIANLFRVYYSLDRGIGLTIVYQKSGTSDFEPVGEAYLAGKNKVIISVHNGSVIEHSTASL